MFHCITTVGLRALCDMSYSPLCFWHCGLQKFQDTISRLDVTSDYLMQILFGSIVPIYDFHCGLLKELDQRLAVWLVYSIQLN